MPVIHQPRTVSIRTLPPDERVPCELLVAEAFCRQLGLPDPAVFHTGATLLGRWYVQPDAVFGAFVEDRLVAVNFAACWGSFGFFGPLAVDPDCWGQGLAQQLLEETVRFFDSHNVRQSGLFTFADSAKHLALYQKFGYWPQSLTALVTKPVSRPPVNECTRFSVLDADAKRKVLGEARLLTGDIFPGLELTKEILAVDLLHAGETVLLHSGEILSGFAICHQGHGSEAETGSCYIKFGAARDRASFSRLIAGCHEFAHSGNAHDIVFGINTARREAYELVVRDAYRTRMLGVAMQRPSEPGFNRPGVFVIDDWR